MILSQMVDPPSLHVESSIGGMGLSYRTIYNKINKILKTNNPVLISHYKAAKLLYIANGIRVKDNKFGSFVLGSLEVLVVYDDLGCEYDTYIYDIAQLDNRNILFIFYNALIGTNTGVRDKFTSLYSIYDALVAMFVQPSLTVVYQGMYSCIARYAPMVLAVKTMLQLGINIKIDDIDTDCVPEQESYLIREDILDLIKTLNEEDLLSYGALCSYVK